MPHIACAYFASSVPCFVCILHCMYQLYLVYPVLSVPLVQPLSVSCISHSHSGHPRSGHTVPYRLYFVAHLSCQTPSASPSIILLSIWPERIHSLRLWKALAIMTDICFLVSFIYLYTYRWVVSCIATIAQYLVWFLSHIPIPLTEPLCIIVITGASAVVGCYFLTWWKMKMTCAIMFYNPVKNAISEWR